MDGATGVQRATHGVQQETTKREFHQRLMCHLEVCSLPHLRERSWSMEPSLP